jgi:hypothetical protein
LKHLRCYFDTTFGAATCAFFETSLKHPIWYRYSCDISLKQFHTATQRKLEHLSLKNTTWKQLTRPWTKGKLKPQGGFTWMIHFGQKPSMWMITASSPRLPPIRSLRKSNSS